MNRATMSSQKRSSVLQLLFTVSWVRVCLNRHKKPVLHMSSYSVGCGWKSKRIFLFYTGI